MSLNKPFWLTVSTGIEPAIFAVTGRRDNRYTTRPSELMFLILKAHCQNKSHQLCDNLLTSVLDCAVQRFCSEKSCQT